MATRFPSSVPFSSTEGHRGWGAVGNAQSFERMEEDNGVFAADGLRLVQNTSM